MSTLSQEVILESLKSVSDPDAGQDIVALNMVKGVQLNESGEVIFMIEVDPERGAMLEPLRQQAEKAVANLPGVKKVTAVLTAQKQGQKQGGKSAVKSSPPDPHGMNKNPVLDLPVKNIIAVASGKGGVGKSTVTSNLAVRLANFSQKKPLKVGLLDADIYGPSQPLMMGLSGQKPAAPNDDSAGGKIEPLMAHGVKVMSIGFMVDDQAPLIWRGPMVQTAIYQLLRDVNWGSKEDPLDVLVVDMPPGTGDAQLTMAQKVPLSGAVIVSTPQDIALIDARKAIEMFRKVNVPILGVVENMSTHICSNCGHEEHIFGHGGARAEAEKLGVPFLGEIPLSMDIREKSDRGEISIGLFDEIAERLISSLK